MNTKEMSDEEVENLVTGLCNDLARIREIVRRGVGESHGASWYGDACHNPAKVSDYIKHVFLDMQRHDAVDKEPSIIVVP